MLKAGWLSNTASVTVHAANCSPPQDRYTCQPSVPCPGDLSMVTTNNCQGFSWTSWQAASLSKRGGTLLSLAGVMGAFAFFSSEKGHFIPKGHKPPQI